MSLLANRPEAEQPDVRDAVPSVASSNRFNWILDESIPNTKRKILQSFHSPFKGFSFPALYVPTWLTTSALWDLGPSLICELATCKTYGAALDFGFLSACIDLIQPF